MRTRISERGYSFVEVLVAIAILLVGLVGPLTIASTGLKNATFAREQNIAFFLAQEGIEGIVYLREEAGLENLENDSLSTWDWVDRLPDACFTGSRCAMDITRFVVYECRPIAMCDLYLYDTGSVRYRHTVGGDDTPYRRMLFFESVDAHTLRVQSVVTWQARAYGTPETVTLETYITDIYAN